MATRTAAKKTSSKAAAKSANRTSKAAPSSAGSGELSALGAATPSTVAIPAEQKPRRNRARVSEHDSQVVQHPPSASDSVDAQLARYREMRDFSVTAEPSGGELGSDPTKAVKLSTPGALPFVIQKHAATRLHYDFRLGLHGVLKSWAVAKGPSYVPGDKRLAVQVEDHPIEYGGFEGIIPKGQYGGGTVMLWDEGTWEPVGDADEGLKKGNLKFVLHGQKLQGRWVLVRMGGHATANDAKPNWLLIKEHDEYERSATDPAITEERPESVITGRDLDAIAAAEDHVWQSKGHDSGKDTAHLTPAAATRQRMQAIARSASSATQEPTIQLLEKLPGTKTAMPGFISPQLAGQADRAPTGPEWVHELKLDGYRIQAHVTRDRSGHRKATLYTRSGLDWTHRMRGVPAQLERLPIENAILDGEIVVLDANGQTSFAELQAAFDEGRPNPFTYYAFDLLYLNGHNLQKLTLLERKQLLAAVLGAISDSPTVRYSQHLDVSGEVLFGEACRLGAEGIISKLGSSAYTSGRSNAWIKVKCVREQEFVIGGFTLPANGSNGVGALLLGYYDRGKLIYAGRTGTGFTHKTSALVRGKLEALRQAKASFVEMPSDAKKGAIYVDPTLVAQVQFRTWTADHLVRQASFKGLREDKPAKAVRREEPDPKLSAKVEAENAEAAAETPAGQRETSADSGDASAGKAKAPTGAKRAKAVKETKPVTDSPARAKKTSGNGQPVSATASPVKIRVTHPERVIDPESGLTKQALVDYYLAVAESMLPHISNRPLSLVRCPEGAGKQCFYQKHVGLGPPEGVSGVKVPNKNKPGFEEYLTLSTAEALGGLGQMNVLEVHPWGSTNDDLEHPDRITFDLDPDEAISWRTLCDSALEVRERLSQLGLKGFLKSTGGKGLHIVAPLTPKDDWAAVKAFTHAFTLQMEAENSLYISRMTKADRKNRIFVDYLRNERGATAVGPYSPRARLNVTASVPLAWSELKSPERPRFVVARFTEWSHRLRRDPWKDISTIDQQIAPAILEAIREQR